MENIIQNPGLQHITEMIFLNLDLENLQTCQLLNKSCRDVLDNPMFWLKKLRMQKGLSEENHNDWTKAIQLTRNTNVEGNVKLYLQKIIKIGHVVDIPCFIDADAVEKSIGFTFTTALEERNLGVLQILASLENNPDPILGYARKILNAVIKGHLNVIKILAPITKDLNSICPKLYSYYGMTPIHYAAASGNSDALRILAPLTTNPNKTAHTGKTPITVAQSRGHYEFARILQSYIDTGHF